MTYIVTSESEINKIAAPALPAPTQDYSYLYQNQFNNVLRLYFNRIQGILDQLSTDSGIIPALTIYTVATLPTAGTAGRRAFVNNALTPVALSAVVGGGALTVPVFDNGTNWIVG